MAEGWRFYARRPVSGLWLNTDVPLSAEITEELNAPGMVSATLPAGLDVHLAQDGAPMWLERGTLLYAELAGQLEWAGVCDFNSPNPDGGRGIEFTGLPGALDAMPYDRVFRQWRPTTLEVVTELLDAAQSNPRGDLGLTPRLIGDDPGGIGDEQPPARPRKPGRRRGESKEHYDDRLLSWEFKVDDWEKKYLAREKYTLAWWEATMVGDELATLAAEVPFDYRVTHAWADPENLVPTHDLEIGKYLGVRRQDVAFIDGVNLAQKLNPETDLEGYANDVIVLGAGEGRKMKRGRASTDDGRLWTTKVVAAKHLKGDKRLRARAEREAKRARVGTRLETAEVWDTNAYAPVTTLKPGDEVWVQSDYVTPKYGAWRRIVAVTRHTDKLGRATLRFQ